jgi:carboxymethylenebutenolidase
MCHPDVPPGWAASPAERREVVVDLPGGEGMPALHVGGQTDAPGVLLIADVFGRSAFYEHLAALIAAAGFQVLLPEFFFRQGPLTEATKDAAFARRAQLDEADSVEDLRAAIAWLRSNSPAPRVGTVGFCMGATFALDLASTQDALATVAYYGFPEPTSTSPPPRPIDLVDGLRGPVLAIWGDQDHGVGLDTIDRYIELASAADPQFASEVIPGLGHGFLGSADLDDPADPGGATWSRALSHLTEHLHEQEIT